MLLFFFTNCAIVCVENLRVGSVGGKARGLWGHPPTRNLISHLHCDVTAMPRHNIFCDVNNILGKSRKSKYLALPWHEPRSMLGSSG